MNILWLSTRSPYPLVSGHSIRGYYTLRNSNEKHRMFVATFVQLEGELEEANLDQVRSISEEVFPFRIPVDMSKVRLGLSGVRNVFSGLPFVAVKYDVPAMRKKIREILNTRKIDLVHFDLLPLIVYADECPELPKVVANHNVESLRLYRWYEAERNVIKKEYLRRQWLRLREFERSYMEKCDCCIVVSETDRQILEEMGIRTKMFVVPNGTDTNYFQPGDSTPVPDTVLWFGHMDVHTNRDAVLYFWREIFPVLRDRHPGVRMQFLGTAPPKEIVEAASGDDRIEATGFVDDIRPYVRRASVIVVPIRIGSGTRVKILDAMAMGKAIVSTSVGCEGLDVTDGRNICVADSPPMFVEKVMGILGDDQLRLRLEDGARRMAIAHDWRLCAAEQERAYQYALKKRASEEAHAGGRGTFDSGTYGRT